MQYYDGNCSKLINYISGRTACDYIDDLCTPIKAERIGFVNNLRVVRGPVLPGHVNNKKHLTQRLTLLCIIILIGTTNVYPIKLKEHQH